MSLGFPEVLVVDTNEPSEVKVGKLCLGICGGYNVTVCGERQRPLTKQSIVLLTTDVFCGL